MSQDSTTQKNWRLSTRILSLMAEDIKLKGAKSETEYVEKALEHYLKCKSEDVGQDFRLLLLRWDAKCLKHDGEIIKAGNWAFYGRGVGAICLDAMLERLGDRGLVAKFLKSRELKLTIQALQKEADRLADKVEAGQLAERLTELVSKVSTQDKLLAEYLKSNLPTTEEKAKLEDIMRQAQTIEELVEWIKQFLQRAKKRPLAEQIVS